MCVCVCVCACPFCVRVRATPWLQPKSILSTGTPAFDMQLGLWPQKETDLFVVCVQWGFFYLSSHTHRCDQRNPKKKKIDLQPKLWNKEELLHLHVLKLCGKIHLESKISSFFCVCLLLRK